MSTDPQLPSPMGSAALSYARRGWPVFPCRECDGEPFFHMIKKVTITPLAKQPYVPRGCSEASTDEATIRRWWKRWPDAQIGLAMGGNGLFAVDFDPRHDAETGEEWTLEQLKADVEAQIGGPLPRTLTIRTPSGGVHLYYRQPQGEPVRNRGVLPVHVDIRGKGGYVIAPPSVCHGGIQAAAGRYRFLEGRQDEEPVTAPERLIEILRAPKARAPAKSAGDAPAGAAPPASSSLRPASPSRPSDDPSRDAIRKYGLSALDGELRELAIAPKGQRNIEINARSFRLGQLVSSGALTEAVVRASVRQVVDGMPDNADPAGAYQTIENGLIAGMAQPRDLSDVVERARERGSRSTRAAAHPRTPATDGQGKPSSQMGEIVPFPVREGAGEEEDRIMRECAFLPQTDLGNLERFLKRYGRDFLFVEAWGWLAWDGKRWSRDMALAMLGRAVQDTMRAIQDEAELVRESGIREEPLPLMDGEQLRAHEAEQRGRLDLVISVKKTGITLLSDTIAKWGRTSEGAGHIKCIAGMAEARLSRRTIDFDLDALLVNVANGTLVFARPVAGGAASVKLVAHRREDLITKIAAASYRPDARSTIYDTFLESVQPDPEMRHFLDVWAGYNMLGDASAQKMAIFYGEGSNGKGVWINTKRAILGDYAWSTSIDTFMTAQRRKGSDATPDLAALAGRRMVYANEAQEGSKFDDALVKELTSDEPKGGVRELLKPPFELHITFKNTIICNNTPRIGTDHGIRRRIQIVPWGVIIPDDQQDLQLKAKLAKEADGILNRMVRGALSFLKGGIPAAAAVQAATEKYLDDNDILGKFIGVAVEKVEGATIGATALHQLFAAWQTWAQLLPATGKPWSPKFLAQQLEKKGFHKKKSSSMIWEGLSPLYERTDFVDSAGVPVERELPAPRRTGSTPRPAPQSGWEEDDDVPP